MTTKPRPVGRPLMSKAQRLVRMPCGSPSVSREVLRWFRSESHRRKVPMSSLLREAVTAYANRQIVIAELRANTEDEK